MFYSICSVELEEKVVSQVSVVSSVAVITTDFAMQNVLLQMGLRLLSVNGLAVTTLRSLIKRCHGCFRCERPRFSHNLLKMHTPPFYRYIFLVSQSSIERNMELEFCQHCGGHTLVRVSISINASGNVQLKQSNRQVFWKRGTVVRISISRYSRALFR